MGTVEVVLPVVAILFSITSFAVNFWHSRRTAVLARKPVLVFEYSPEEGGWIIRNIGQGPALNVLVAQKRPGGEWFRPVRIPAMGRDGSFRVFWAAHENETGFGATFTDFEGTAYTSKVGNDLSQVFRGYRLPKWDESQINAHWRLRPDL